jgi:hypothetical protein
MLYDFLVVRQIVPSNPAHAVRGPKYVVKKGKTPVWSREDTKTLLDSIRLISNKGTKVSQARNSGIVGHPLDADPLDSLLIRLFDRAQ